MNLQPHAGTSVDGEPYVYPVVTPRFAISTTETLLEALQVLVDSDKSLAIQTHISENLAEVQKVKDLFQHLWPGEPVTYAQVYDHYDLLRHNTILAHAVHLEESELELVKKRKCGISHCPTSNFNLTSGVAKIGDMLDRGIKVSLAGFVRLHKSIPDLNDSPGRPRDRRFWWILTFDS